MKIKYADVMKLVDVLDSKSCEGNLVPVRLRPSANKNLSLVREVFILLINLSIKI